MRIAGYFLLLSAALHIVGVVLEGESGSLFLLGPAALYVMLFAGLSRGMIWVAWLAFICMLGGAAGTVAELSGTTPLAPVWVLWGIFGADLIAAVLLFAAIWSGRHSETAAG
jgi:hypothetical protein